MSREQVFIDRLKAIARHPAARGLADDCAVLPMGNRDLILTHDMLVEGVHYLPDDPPEDVAWKLVAVNLSDLAAKGATPVGVLLGYPLGREEAWDAAFAEGLEAALAAFDTPLLGGDTVVVPSAAPRQLGLTAIGKTAPGAAPSRGGAHAGDLLCVTGVIGAAGRGLTLLLNQDPRAGGNDADAVRAYRRPIPRLAEGRALAPHVHAMADISDGLLLDARRMADASGLAVAIDLDAIPVSAGTAPLAAAVAGDDYELLFALDPLAIPPDLGTTPITIVGRFTIGAGLSLFDRTGPVPLPAMLGYEHS